ncbi:MAG TPA: hypothetical protein VMX17_09270 [Candidatus Glassbacteria bacterium]|nr:hypothetical protein [Candidatus Glassbacteria bacterium]
MKQNFLKLLGNIKLYSSYYFAIISVLGVVWGAFALYDGWRDNNKILQTNVNTIIKAQSSAAKTDSLLLKQQEIMKEQLNEIQGTTEALENSYVKRLSNDKTLTKQDFLEYMEGLSFDTKKNSLSGQLEARPPLMLDPTASK